MWHENCGAALGLSTGSQMQNEFVAKSKNHKKGEIHKCIRHTCKIHTHTPVPARPTMLVQPLRILLTRYKSTPSSQHTKRLNLHINALAAEGVTNNSNNNNRNAFNNQCRRSTRTHTRSWWRKSEWRRRARAHNTTKRNHQQWRNELEGRTTPTLMRCDDAVDRKPPPVYATRIKLTKGI